MISCYRSGKYFKSNLNNVALERDFYRVSELTEDDIARIRRTIIDPMKNPFLRRVSLEWIKLF